MDALVTVDVRKLPAVAKAMGIPREELAKRAGTQPPEISRFFSALSPGGLMDRLTTAITDIAAEQVSAATQ